MKKAKFSIIFACLLQIPCCSVAKLCLTLTPWTAAHQASLSFTISQSLLQLVSTVMPYNHLVLCHPLLLPSIFPSIRVFPSESALHIRWPKYWSFSFSISPPSEYSGLIQVPPEKHLSILKMAIFQIYKNATQGNIYPETQFCLVTSLRSGNDKVICCIFK